ncbi:putative RNA-binding Zn ribbon-like protein [Lipingzhangella halophila]|uniref:Putative RNA-binding Zn ribbon-like protein n=1 Tax=Lipingzhangella halophila TaxID=1783352 RepID=A0A7W7W2F6_9ACTN|nr:ABATE domain-containing protein [Lipingzhangella halophila]MBB4931711.1 putative RNA-binding Zn ribbon-like protein [Lipingzhangella halophila]
MRFAFVSGNPALDLVGTVESRGDEPADLLATPADLEQWVLECDELPDQATADIATFTSALRLREAIYQLALDRMRARRFAPASLAIVNNAAARPLPTVELSDAGVRLSGDLRCALAHVARSAITVLADHDACVKECGRPSCTRLYLDRSRGARRTWCGMEGCGNRVKAAAYRARRRAAGQGRGPKTNQASTTWEASSPE